MIIRGLTFPIATYRQRRDRALALLAKQWDRPVPLLFIGSAFEAIVGKRQDTWFDYYSGCEEPDAALLIDPSRPERDTLFLSAGDAKRVVWDGRRLGPSGRACRLFGMDACRDRRWLERSVAAAAARAGHHLAMCFRKREQGTQARAFAAWEDKLKGVTLLNAEPVLAPQRMIKEPEEVAWTRRAIAITRAGLLKTWKRLPQLTSEAEVAAELAMHYRRHDWSPLAFPTIVGSALDGATLHYQHNDQPLVPGAPVLIDSGATAGGYCADVTRTVPQHGRFSDRRFRAVYELVLEANAAVRAAARPGLTWKELDDLGWAVIKKAGFKRHHGIGHQLGLDVHDVIDRKNWRLKPGMIITNEPGIYLPREGFGIRIEDDLLITADGCEELTAAIPKTVRDIERVMGGS